MTVPATSEMILEQIAAALGTAEEGAALVEVARNAHRAELELAKFKYRVRDLGWSVTSAYAKLSD